MSSSEIHGSNVREPQHPHPDQRVIEIVAGLVLAAVALALLFWVIPTHVGHNASQHDISPDFFPKAAAWMLLGLSVALVIIRLVKTTESDASMENKIGGFAILLQLFAWLLVAAIAYAGIAFFSFHLTAFALIVAGALVCHYRHWPVLAIVAIVAPVFIGQISWLVFSVKF